MSAYETALVEEILSRRHDHLKEGRQPAVIHLLPSEIVTLMNYMHRTGSYVAVPTAAGFMQIAGMKIIQNPSPPEGRILFGQVPT